MKRLFAIILLTSSFLCNAQLGSTGYLKQPVPKDPVYFFKAINIEFLGRQNVNVINKDLIVPAKSQIGVNFDLIYNRYSTLHPETQIGYRLVNLSNIDSIGVKKHQDLYINIGTRVLPINDAQLRPTLSVAAGLSFRGASLFDQIALNLSLRGGLVYSLGNDSYNMNDSFLFFECAYNPLGSDAIAGIELMPSYIFSVGIVMLFVEDE